MDRADRLVTNVLVARPAEHWRQRVQRRQQPDAYTHQTHLSHSSSCILRHTNRMRVERTENRMLRWMLGITLKDRKRNDDIRHAVGVCCITDKIRESRLRWYGHVQQREDGHCVKRILEAEVYGRRNRGRQRKSWINTISHDLISLNLTPVDV